MVTDNETNILYLSDCLAQIHPLFFKRLKEILSKANIEFTLLPNTKDIWAVDFMPIQVSSETFVQFVYNPDYLQGKKWRKTVSDVDSICEIINVKTYKSDIVLDGGNVIKTKDKIIMCDKIFDENPKYTRKELSTELRNLLQVDKLFIVPQQPKDFTGHADGMVRFLDSDTVIINDFSKENQKFQRAFKIALENAGLQYIEIPYNPYENKHDDQANGIYINFLQMENMIILPTFGMKEDDIVLKQFEQLFTGYNIFTLNCDEIASKGGVLNCITWNIRSSKN
jgi:agmatine deiminase